MGDVIIAMKVNLNVLVVGAGSFPEIKSLLEIANTPYLSNDETARSLLMICSRSNFYLVLSQTTTIFM